MSEPVETTFQRKLRERREQEALSRRTNKPIQFDADLIPDDERRLTDADKALNDAVSRIDIISAYNKYCGKMRPVVRPNQRENIMISCPIPGHTDTEPSAAINLNKQVWICYACEQGGDISDLAAIAKGYAWPDGYKKDGSFHKLQEEIAADFGYTAIKLPGGGVVVSQPEAEAQAPVSDESVKPVETTTIPSNLDTPDTPDSSITPQSADAEIIDLFEESNQIVIPTLNWDILLEPDTFLSSYMACVRVDDAPDEFHFFHALMALGMALGRDVTLFDSVPVYGNLFICTLGRSGSGKSKAKAHLDRLLNYALPYKQDDPNSKGTKRITAPGSAEVLIHNFQKPVFDPADTKGRTILYNAPVRGIIEYNELSALISRTNRLGSAIKPTMMQFYDMEKVVSTSSMGTGVKEASEPFACAVTSTQPRALKNLLSLADDASGFLNRWAFILGTPKKKFAIGGSVVDVSPAVKPLTEIFAWAGTFFSKEQITWSEEASELFENFFYEHVEPDKVKSQSDLTVRIDLLLKKLVLLFTANLKQKVVPVKAVMQAIECYDFLIAGFALPAAEMGTTLVTEVRNAILSCAEKQYRTNGRGLTLHAINKSLWRRNYPLKLLNDTVEQLVKVGMLVMESPKATDKGRPTVRYRYAD